MADDGQPQTRLEQILWQRHWTVPLFIKKYRAASGIELSERQAYRWISGNLKKLPYPQARAGLERLFNEPAGRLLGPPFGAGFPDHATSELRHRPELARGTARRDWEGQLIAMAADRARDFLARAESSNVGAETLDQLWDDVRRLAVAYQQLPLKSILADITETQTRAFGLLDGRQRPSQARDLYLLAGIASGLMAKVSHDLGSPHDALTQARVAYACADNAGHDGLRAWARGLQALITYWTGRFAESVRYANDGVAAGERSRGTASIWLVSGKARALAALNRTDEARAEVARAIAIRDEVEFDELDEVGGLCTFGRPRQLYYAADALAWAGESEAWNTEKIALEALEAYAAAPATDRAFGDEAGTRCDLAVARIFRGELEGAAAAVDPVLELPPGQRIHGIVTSVAHVQRVLSSISDNSNSVAARLQGEIAGFVSDRLALPE